MRDPEWRQDLCLHVAVQDLQRTARGEEERVVEEGREERRRAGELTHQPRAPFLLSHVGLHFTVHWRGKLHCIDTDPLYTKYGQQVSIYSPFHFFLFSRLFKHCFGLIQRYELCSNTVLFWCGRVFPGMCASRSPSSLNKFSILSVMHKKATLQSCTTVSC